MPATINNTMVKIQTVTVGSGGASSIDFTSIPQTYTDLLLKVSLRGSATGGAYAHYAVVSFNSNTSNRSWRRVAGYGSNQVYSDNSSSLITMGSVPSSSTTANTFTNAEWYIPNYTSSNYKSWSIDGVVDTNSSTDWEDYLMAQLWSNTSAITSISITLDSGNFVQYSSATLYGITATPNTTKASGGIIYQDATYMYHVFPYSSTFTPSTALSADILCIAGGGAGGTSGGDGSGGGAGGAGGIIYSSSQSLTATSYTVTVGAGGAGTTNRNISGPSGSNSNVTGGALSLTAAVGGGGGAGVANAGSSPATSGGSGGGGSGSSSATERAGASSSASGQGNSGGTGVSAGGGAGGGGYSAVGSNASSGAGGAGGNGSSAYSSWAITTGTGQIVGGTGYYAGGGGGGDTIGNASTSNVGGYGGGGAGGNGSTGSQNGTAGTANTGGGGGGAGYISGGQSSGSGGSGVVIVRYAK